MNRRGLSDIVTNVLIILLVLVAVGILWSFLQPTITQSSSELDGAEVIYGLDLSLASYDDSDLGTSLGLVVKRGAGEGDLTGVNVVLEDDTGTTVVVMKEVTLNELETESITIDSSEYSTLGTITKISIAPIIRTNAGNEKFGGIVHTEEIGSGTPSASCTDGPDYNDCTYGALTGRNYVCSGGSDVCECYADFDSSGDLDPSLDSNSFVAECIADESLMQNSIYDCDGDGIWECGPGGSNGYDDFGCLGILLTEPVSCY